MRNRPAAKVLLAYLAGIMLAYKIEPYIITPIGLWISLALCLITDFAAYKKRWLSLSSTFIFLSLTVIGFLRYEIYMTPPKGFESVIDKQVKLAGTVLDNRSGTSGRSSLIIKGTAYLQSDESVFMEGNFLIRSWGKDRNPFTQEYGSLVEVCGKLAQPSLPDNPGEYNFRDFYRRRGIFATMNVDEVSEIRELGPGTSGISSWIIGLRNRAEEVVDRITPQKIIFNIPRDESLAILKGVLLGTREDIQGYEAFTRTATAHILVVSGANFGIIVFWTLLASDPIRRMLVSKFQSRSIILESKSTAYIPAIPLAIIFSLMAGLGYSVIRALIFVLLAIISRFINRDNDLFSHLASAALFILILFPGAILDLAFQLSFVSVLSIVYLMPYWLKMTLHIKRDKVCRRILYWFIQFTGIPLCAQTGTWIFIAHSFGTVSLSSVFVNPVITSLVFFITPIGFLSCLIGLIYLPLAIPLGWVTHILISAVNYIVYLFAGEPYSSILGFQSDFPNPSITVPQAWFSFPMIALYSALIVSATKLIRSPLFRIKLLNPQDRIVNTEKLRNEFEKNGHQLSPYAEISDDEKGRKWKIRDFGMENRAGQSTNMLSRIFRIQTVAANRTYIAKKVEHITEDNEKRQFLQIYLTRNPLIIALAMVAMCVCVAAILYDGHLLKVTFLDVGQGDSAFAMLPNGYRMLIDGGGSSDIFDAGKHVIVPFLKRNRMTKLDLMISTHPDNDHTGGLIYTMDKVKVSKVITGSYGLTSPTYDRFAEKLNCIESYDAQPGNLMSDRDISLISLNPRNYELLDDEDSRMNNNSVVLKLIYKDVSFLFTGDIQEDAENGLIRSGNDLGATVIKVPHHGSKSSSSEDFVIAVHPGVAIISVGRNNIHGHPAPEVIERYEMIGAKIHRTDKEGAITIVTDGKKGWIDAMLEIRD